MPLDDEALVRGLREKLASGVQLTPEDEAALNGLDDVSRTWDEGTRREEIEVTIHPDSGNFGGLDGKLYALRALALIERDHKREATADLLDEMAALLESARPERITHP